MYAKQSTGIILDISWHSDRSVSFNDRFSGCSHNNLISFNFIKMNLIDPEEIYGESSSFLDKILDLVIPVLIGVALAIIIAELIY